jgi:hypothetical protein
VGPIRCLAGTPSFLVTGVKRLCPCETVLLGNNQAPNVTPRITAKYTGGPSDSNIPADTCDDVAAQQPTRQCPNHGHYEARHPEPFEHSNDGNQ